MHSVSERALIARINRRLHPLGERIRTCCESSRYFYDLGRHYVVDDRNCIVAKDIDIEQWATGPAAEEGPREVALRVVRQEAAPRRIEVCVVRA